MTSVADDSLRLCLARFVVSPGDPFSGCLSEKSSTCLSDVVYLQ